MGSGHVSEVGTVQGGSISPLLANVYLHYVFDLWVQRWRTEAGAAATWSSCASPMTSSSDSSIARKPSGSSPSCASVRAVRAGAAPRQDAPDRVRPLRGPESARRGDGKPETFNFLGFTHSCGEDAEGTVHGAAADDAQEVAGEAARGEDRTPATHARARPGARRVSARGRPRAHPVLRRARERSGLSAFRERDRRSSGGASCAPQSDGNQLTWRRMARYIARWLPTPRICHPTPRALRRHHPRQEPDAVMPHVRICGGGDQRWSFLLRLNTARRPSGDGKKY